MELTQIKAFYEIAKSGSFSKGAEKLNITQPALSRQIESLEKSVGINLFNRHSRGVQLTEAGRRLFEYVEQMLRLAAEAERTLQEIQGLETGQLSIGACTTVGNYLLPASLSTFLKLYPKLDISLDLGKSNDIVERVMNKEFDLAFIAGIPEHPGVCNEPIHEDEILFLTSPGHPLCEKANFDPQLLAKEIFVFRELGSATRQALDSILQRIQVKPAKVITLGDTEAVKRVVMAGTGITFLSKHTVELELQQGLLCAPDIPELKLSRQMLCIYPKGVHFSPAALAFLSHLKKDTHNYKFPSD
ncbi:MAG: LysR family transcriptional regulator [Thermincola sp.]|jgi:DNA-binding transcriptional LysR family regulator|nr:LysR family transcriptional regulator [Thermincola sp.]MDT3702492.1 LysR family transcriptional regulator [Thermincola sp.]